MTEPKTKAEAMNEARQAKERATLYAQRAAKAKKDAPTTAKTLRSLAETNRKQHARFLALAATLP